MNPNEQKPSASKRPYKEAGPGDHYDIRFNYELRIHCSKIDESFVDYPLESVRGNFMCYFDQALYEPPQLVLNV